MAAVRRSDWERLGRAIEAHRGAAGHPNRAAYARRVGVSDSTLAAVESGARTNFRPATLDAITAHLGWKPGTWRDVLTGAEPVVVRPTGFDFAWPQVDAVAVSLDSQGRRAAAELADALHRVQPSDPGAARRLEALLKRLAEN